MRVHQSGKCGSKQHDGSQSRKQRGHKGKVILHPGATWSDAQIR